MTGNSFSDSGILTVPLLMTNGAFGQTWYFSIPDGEYHVSVEADYNTAIDECDEDNNKKTITFVK